MIELPNLDLSRPRVGFDIGTSFGWSVIYDRHHVLTGTWDFSVGTHEGGALRFLRSRKAITDLLTEHRPCIVGYELVRGHSRAGQKGNNIQAAHLFGAWKAQVLEISEGLGIPCAYAGVSEVKKFATGKGNANKSMMVKATKAALPFWDGTEDAADAYWVARCIEARELGPRE